MWNPSRLDLDGETPPVPEPLDEPEEDEPGEAVEYGHRHEMRLKFWTALQVHEQKLGGLHADQKPGHYHWQGKRQDGLWWNFVVRQGDTRAELYIDLPNQSRNKAIFDALVAKRNEVEAEFGGKLDWQRLDAKRASRVTIGFPGGWVDESTWPDVIPKVVAAMERLHKALAKRAVAAKDAS